MSTSDGESSRLEFLSGWHIRQPACLFFLCTLWILAIHIVKLIMHFHIFLPLKMWGTVQHLSGWLLRLNCRKSKGYVSFFFCFVNEKWEAVRGINVDRECFFTVGMCIIMLEVLLEEVNHYSLSPLMWNVQVVQYHFSPSDKMRCISLHAECCISAISQIHVSEQKVKGSNVKKSTFPKINLVFDNTSNISWGILQKQLHHIQTAALLLIILSHFVYFMTVLKDQTCYVSLSFVDIDNIGYINPRHFSQMNVIIEISRLLTFSLYSVNVTESTWNVW